MALSEVLIFKLFRTEAATGTVSAPPIVITLYIIKHRHPHDFPAYKAFPVDTFHLQRVEEAFRAAFGPDGRTSPAAPSRSARWRSVAT